MKTLAVGVMWGLLAARLASAGTVTMAPAERAAAARKAADESPACRVIAPFYWELGDRAQILASGTTGDGSVTRQTEMAIASASKWLFGAYALQKLEGRVSPLDAKFLKMMSGYHHLSATSCIFTPTIASCFAKGDNAGYSREDDGRFFYNGGHFQKWGVDHGLGAYDRAKMAADYRRLLGEDIHLSFGAFQLAGGIKTTAADFALFLRKILNGQLQMSKFLGANPTCTLRGPDCAEAVQSPIPEAWHYSYGHWVEDSPHGGDGAFSSPGAFGFYPWIDATKTTYGVIARRHRRSARDGGSPDQGRAGYQSALCGRVIRRAYASMPTAR